MAEYFCEPTPDPLPGYPNTYVRHGDIEDHIGLARIRQQVLLDAQAKEEAEAAEEETLPEDMTPGEQAERLNQILDASREVYVRITQYLFDHYVVDENGDKYTLHPELKGVPKGLSKAVISFIESRDRGDEGN